VNSVTPIYGSRDCSLPLIRLHNIIFWGFIFFILFKSVTLYLIFLISAIAHRLFKSVEELSELLHRLLNEGEMVIKWDRKIKNKGNAILSGLAA